MINALADKYAIIIGKGSLPTEVIESMKKKSLNFIVVGINGMCEKKLVHQYNGFFFYIGEINKLIINLNSRNITKVILVGQITRPSLFSIRWDDLGKSLFKEYISKIHGDSSLLSLVIKIFEDYNFTVVSAQSLAPDILAEAKIYTTTQPPLTSHQDIIEGFKIAKELSKFDIGQSIVYQQNMVVAVEAVEGTKEMLNRSAKFIRKTGHIALLIKVQKIHQDTRVDLPAIGPLTIKQLKKASINGIVIEANSTIILERELTVKLANKYGIFIMALVHNNLSYNVFK